MKDIREDFEAIYHKVTGNRREDTDLPWVESAFVEGTEYDQAFEDFWKARENLCRRFGLEWEDVDLELFMNGVLKLEQDLAWRMFCYGMVYAQKGCQR